jgi:hypothetical protein
MTGPLPDVDTGNAFMEAFSIVIEKLQCGCLLFAFNLVSSKAMFGRKALAPEAY